MCKELSGVGMLRSVFRHIGIIDLSKADAVRGETRSPDIVPLNQIYRLEFHMPFGGLPRGLKTLASDSFRWDYPLIIQQE